MPFNGFDMNAPSALADPPAAPTSSASYKWLVILMLWFICFFNYADRQTISAVFPELEREFGFNKEQLGLIGSAFMWAYAGCALVAGLVCDRFRRKDLILGGCLFWSFITMLTGWCSKLWQFVVVRGLEGFGETFYFPASMSLASDYHGPNTRSRALAFHQSSVYVGTILGSWLGAWLAMRFGWRIGFYLFGAAGIVLSLLLYAFLREPVRGQAEVPETSLETTAADGSPSPWAEGRGEGDRDARRPGPVYTQGGGPAPTNSLSIPAIFRLILDSPSVILLMLAFAAANAVATVFLVWTPSFLKDKFHYDLATAGLSGTVFIHTASAVSVPIAGLFADRLTTRVPGGRIIIQVAGLLGGAIFVFLVGSTASQLTLVFSMTLFGFFKGFYDSGIFASMYDSIEPGARGTAAGIMNTIGWGGGAFGPWFVGWLAEHGSKPTKIENMSTAISYGGIIYLLAAGLLLAAIPLYGKRSRSAGESLIK
jgi:MFS family permease